MRLRLCHNALIILLVRPLVGQPTRQTTGAIEYGFASWTFSHVSSGRLLSLEALIGSTP